MQLITDAKEIRKHMRRFHVAVMYSRNSVCRKSRRGAVIYREALVRGQSILIGTGWSDQTQPMQCENCPRIENHSNGDHYLCLEIHAEQAAILDALEKGHRRDELLGAEMYQVKTDPMTGAIKLSSDPSCTWCSRYLERYGIIYYLIQKEGIIQYLPNEISQLSLENARKNYEV